MVPYETGLKERKSHWEAGAKQNFDQGLYISQKQFFIRAADYGPAPKIGKPMEYDRISYTIKSCQMSMDCIWSRWRGCGSNGKGNL